MNEKKISLVDPLFSSFAGKKSLVLGWRIGEQAGSTAVAGKMATGHATSAPTSAGRKVCHASLSRPLRLRLSRVSPAVFRGQGREEIAFT